ncbi:hypothetical protein Tco_0480844 [Tanacetum coccineum]
MQKESVSKQRRKSAKAEPSIHTNPLFDELPDDTMDYMDTEDAQDVGRIRNGVNEEKEGTEDVVSTDKEKDSTDKEKEGTDKEKDSTVSLDEVSREKEKGVELKDVEETERPRPTLTRSLLTLKHLPKIDLKDKGKKKIEEEDESDTESEDIPEAEKKFKQLARDEEMARKLQEDWETEEERKRLAEEEATKTALLDEYDFIQARIEADRLLALRLQDEEREQFTVEERAKFLHDTIAAQRRFLAEQRAIAIRNKPPTRTQLRNQMMTYLKHVGNKKHSDLKNKTFEEIQALYEKKKVAKETPKKEDTAKVPAKVDVTEQGTKKRKGGHMKMLAQRKGKDTIRMGEKIVNCRLDKVSSPDGDFLGFTESMGNSGHSTILWRLELEDGTVHHLMAAKICSGLGSQNGKEQTYQESSKKQRLKEDKEPDEVEEVEEDDEDALKRYLVIKKDDDIAIDVIALATKLLVIVDYKMHKEGLMETDIDKGRNQAKNRHVEHGMEKRL